MSMAYATCCAEKNRPPIRELDFLPRSTELSLSLLPLLAAVQMRSFFFFNVTP